MYRYLWWIVWSLLCGTITNHLSMTWGSEMSEITEKLAEIKDAVAKIQTNVDSLNLKVEEIDKKVQSQQLELGDINKSLKDGGICSGEKGMVEEIKKTIEEYGKKQLKDQQSIKQATNEQKDELVQIKNRADEGFNKMFEKIENLLEVTAGGEPLVEVSKGLQKLAAVYNRQESKIDTMKISLERVTESNARAQDDCNMELQRIFKNISAVLHEKDQPLSSAASSRVNRAVTLATVVVQGANRLTELEPKLEHATRLSEEMSKGLSDGPLRAIVSNLTSSLKAMKASTPIVVSTISTNSNQLKSELVGLKNMSKYNDCPADLTLEIRNHQEVIMKYLEENRKPVKTETGKEEEVWNAVMKRLENIERASDSNSILDKLTALRNEIRDARNSIDRMAGEDDELSDDTVFG